MIQLFLFILIVLILSKKYTTLEHFKNNNNNNPIFSIIIPLYNNDQYIIATIKSVIYQTFKNFEIIIIDDKSTDKSFIKTQKFIKPYSNIKLLKNYKNIGVYKTINIGLNYINGTYFTVLGSDDTFHPNRLEEDYNSLNNTDYLATISKYNRYNVDGNLIHKPRFGESMITFHKSIVAIIGKYLNCRYGGDTEYMNRFKLIIGKDKLKYNNKIMYKSIHKEDNSNLTKIYNFKHDRKRIKHYFDILHQNYNSKITKTIQNDLFRLLPKISITKCDHINNIKILKIK